MANIFEQIGKVLKKVFSKGNIKAVETYAISEIQQVVTVLAPAVYKDAVDVINLLENKTMPNIEKLQALAVEVISLANNAKNVIISKDIALAVAQEVFNRAKAAALAEAKKLLQQL